ncbi:hypothetical protein GUJ93_ZPchr0006g42283 [Zizania palustris]|uniref:MLO-like protein n=1 Tax=Zizania palustris TaxID=103762 RepID=A0A8J5SLD2_ZIZPA|nr:hypothetical protein GUJ93_ZPchr0006g42283 [Zizania palustris]
MEESSLSHTPTWVVAAVCLGIVSVSLAAERFLHLLGKALSGEFWAPCSSCLHPIRKLDSLKRQNQKTLYSALERLKEELMLLGFISFVLSLSQNFIVGICIPENAMHLMLPCKKENRHAGGVKLCKKKDEVPLLSVEALHQLHIFIFVLGLVHVLFCATTILLGVAKIKKWKHWEAGIRQEMQEKSQQIETTPSHTVLQRNHQHEFVSKRTKGSWMKLAVVSWIIAFLKQFHDSVSKSDYKALRSAFVLIHYPKHADFDFHKYLVRALEHDFKRVVGISWYLWLFVILFLLLNINGWHTYFWLAFLPLFLLLVVGAKLEHIITRLAQDAMASLPPSEGSQGADGVTKMASLPPSEGSQGADGVTKTASLPPSEGSQGTERVPNIKPSKEHFWFHRPEIVLHLIHFIIFQNSFEIGFFFWVLVTYGFNSCIMEKKVYAISRLVIGVLIEVICSYITLPLYAIVTHMGGDIKLHGIGSGLHETVTEWAAGVKGRSTLKNAGDNPTAATGSTGASASKVEVTQPRNHECSGSSPAPEPYLDVIVSVVDDGGGYHNRR